MARNNHWLSQMLYLVFSAIDYNIIDCSSHTCTSVEGKRILLSCITIFDKWLDESQLISASCNNNSNCIIHCLSAFYYCWLIEDERLNSLELERENLIDCVDYFGLSAFINTLCLLFFHHLIINLIRMFKSLLLDFLYLFR